MFGDLYTGALRYRAEVLVEGIWNLMAHGDAWEETWRGNWRMEWVASTPTLPRNLMYPAFLKLMLTPRLPAVDWTEAPADLNGLVRFGERRNLVSARVPSHFKRTILIYKTLAGSLKISECCWEEENLLKQVNVSSSFLALEAPCVSWPTWRFNSIDLYVVLSFILRPLPRFLDLLISNLTFI